MTMTDSAPRTAVEMSGLEIKDPTLYSWVQEIAALTRPDRIYVCDGSQEEYDFAAELGGGGNFVRLERAEAAETATWPASSCCSGGSSSPVYTPTPTASGRSWC
ncbi:hypothetical protein [Georgenia sp. SUBG003]|uniref:hypothetical protein n=1 Tax=Georgenia sp. SUBG003 TaxID=1497974 RepID=UPI003AB4D54C